MAKIEDWHAEVSDEYGKLREAIPATEPDLRKVLEPIDQARKLLQDKQIALLTVQREHRDGNLADDQLPRLRDRHLSDVRTAAEAALKASEARMRDLPDTLARSVFAAPARGPETAEAKSDLSRALDSAPDRTSAYLGAVDAAASSGDGLALRLLVSDWGRAYLASTMDGETADDLQAEARTRAADHPDLFPGAARDDLSRMARLDDVDKARMAGLGLLDLERQALEAGRL